MKAFLLLALPFAARMVGGRPALEDGVYKLELTATQCTAKSGPGSNAEYTGTCDKTYKAGYVLLSSDACASISESSCRVKAMSCDKMPYYYCINADHSNICLPTAQSPPGFYTTSGLCPQGLLCCQGTRNEKVEDENDGKTSQLPADFLNQISFSGAENQILGLEGDDIALLNAGDPTYQPFIADSPGSSISFDTADNVNLAAFQLDPSPPLFANQFDDNNQLFTADSTVPWSGDADQQLVASDTDPSLFYPLDA